MYYKKKCCDIFEFFFTTTIEIVMLYSFFSLSSANEIFYFSCILSDLLLSSFYKKSLVRTALFINSILLIYILCNFILNHNIHLIFFFIISIFLVIKNLFRLRIIEMLSAHEHLITEDYESITVISV